MTTNQNGPLVNPIWMLRILPAAAMLLIGLSMLVKNPEVHSMLAGGAFGLLFGYCVGAWNVKAVVLKNTTQPSDVQSYPLS